jgi:hypothetical protein
MKNEHISAYAQSKIEKLQKDILELTMKNAELKDMVLDLGGDYEKESNWEITNDTGMGDFEVQKPMIYESPDGGETVYGRRAGDYENKEVINNPNQLELF